MHPAIKPFMNIGPGEFIKEELEFRHWSQEDLADVLSVSLKTVNHLINHKQSITLDMARLLGKAFGQSPQYWINLDANYRLREQADEIRMNEIETRAVIYKHMPINEMMQRGWISTDGRVSSLVRAVKKFWDIADLDFTFLEKQAEVCFRKSESFANFNVFYALTWLQMAKKSAESLARHPFQKEILLKIVANYSEYTLMENGVQTILGDLHRCGVKFLVLPHLQKTYIDGAAFCENTNPVIAYSPRYDRIDHFWFTLAHEIAHVVNDIRGSGQTFIDDIYKDPTDEKEEKANQAATTMLKTNKILKYFKNYDKYISEFRIKACAKELAVAEAVVVGTLQYHNILSQKNLNKFKTKIKEQIPLNYWIEKTERTKTAM